MEITMHRRMFLKAGIAGAAAHVTGHSLFPAELQAKIPADLRVTALKVIPVWTGSMNYVFVKLYTNHGITGVGEGGSGNKVSTDQSQY